jgi:hypothetical protein
MKKIRKLHSLNVAEVSFVKTPANKQRFHVLKFKEGGPKQKEPAPMAGGSSKKKNDSEGKKIKKIKKASEEEGEVVEGAAPPAVAGAAEGVDAADSESPRGEIPQADLDEAMEAAAEAFREMLDELGHGYPDAHLALLNDGDNQLEGEEEINKMTKETKESESKETVTKSAPTGEQAILDAMPEAVRAKVEAIFKTNQDLVARLEESEKREETRELIQKSAEFTHLGLAQDDVVAALRDAKKAGKESYERITKMFGAVSEQAKNSSLFKELGSSLPGGLGTQSQASRGSDRVLPGDAVYAKIEKGAEGYVAKSGGAVTPEKAMELFLATQEGRALQREYEIEKGRVN